MQQNGQKGGQRGMRDAAPEVTVVPLDREERACEVAFEFEDVAWTPIRESLLCELPDALVGVELRRIGRKALQVNPPGARAQRPDEPAAMGIAAVPQDDEVPADLPEQLSVAESRGPAVVGCSPCEAESAG